MEKSRPCNQGTMPRTNDSVSDRDDAAARHTQGSGSTLSAPWTGLVHLKPGEHSHALDLQSMVAVKQLVGAISATSFPQVFAIFS